MVLHVGSGTGSTLSIILYSALSLSPALAATFNVNSTVDAVDSHPGDGVCQTSGAKCTLRAAIQESNALAGLDNIILPAGTYKPVLGSVDEDLGLEGDFDILDDLNITGSSADDTILTGNVNQYRIFHIHVREDRSLPKVSINKVTLTRGLESNDAAVIYNAANLLLDKVIITKAGLGSSAIYNKQGSSPLCCINYLGTKNMSP